MTVKEKFDRFVELYRKGYSNLNKREQKTFRTFVRDMFTFKHTGKMSGMISLSTACTCNGRCKKNAKIKGSICEKCYAMQQLKARDTNKSKFERNYDILTTMMIPVEAWPVLNANISRIEAFGDVDTPLQVLNYCNLCTANPDTTFSVWTKNPDIYKIAFDTLCVKPANMIVIYSALFIDRPVSITKLLKAFPFIDKVFTVFTKRYAKKNNIDINCGARCCATCKRCYDRNTGTCVNEILK